MNTGLMGKTLWPLIAASSNLLYVMIRNEEGSSKALTRITFTIDGANETLDASGLAQISPSELNSQLPYEVRRVVYSHRSIVTRYFLGSVEYYRVQAALPSHSLNHQLIRLLYTGWLCYPCRLRFDYLQCHSC